MVRALYAKIKHIHSVGHAILNESGELVEFIGSTVDITERKRAEERAQSHNEAVRLALNSFVEELDLNRFLGHVITGLTKQFQATPVLAMSSLIDEAYGVLVGSWWMHRATGWGVRIGIFTAIGISIALVAAVAWGLAGVELGLKVKAYESFTTLVLAGVLKTFSSMVLGVASCVAIGVAYVLVELFLSIFSKSEPGLGLANPDENLVCNVCAQRTLPSPIRSTNKRYGTWQLLRHSKGVLFHSRIYFHAPAIRDMAKWISSEAA